MKESEKLLSNWVCDCWHSIAEFNSFTHKYLAAKRKERTEDEKMHAVYALAFALLECRSENEALLVLQYFAKTKSRKSPSAESVRGPDGSGTD